MAPFCFVVIAIVCACSRSPEIPGQSDVVFATKDAGERSVEKLDSARAASVLVATLDLDKCLTTTDSVVGCDSVEYNDLLRSATSVGLQTAVLANVANPGQLGDTASLAGTPLSIRFVASDHCAAALGDCHDLETTGAACTFDDLFAGVVTAAEMHAGTRLSVVLGASQGCSYTAAGFNVRRANGEIAPAYKLTRGAMLTLPTIKSLYANWVGAVWKVRAQHDQLFCTKHPKWWCVMPADWEVSADIAASANHAAASEALVAGAQYINTAGAASEATLPFQVLGPPEVFVNPGHVLAWEYLRKPGASPVHTLLSKLPELGARRLNLAIDLVAHSQEEALLALAGISSAYDAVYPAIQPGNQSRSTCGIVPSIEVNLILDPSLLPPKLVADRTLYNAFLAAYYTTVKAKALLKFHNVSAFGGQGIGQPTASASALPSAMTPERPASEITTENGDQWTAVVGAALAFGATFQGDGLSGSNGAKCTVVSSYQDALKHRMHPITFSKAIGDLNGADLFGVAVTKRCVELPNGNFVDCVSSGTTGNWGGEGQDVVKPDFHTVTRVLLSANGPKHSATKVKIKVRTAGFGSNKPAAVRYMTADSAADSAQAKVPTKYVATVSDSAGTLETDVSFAPPGVVFVEILH